MDERIISFLEDNNNKISFTYEEMISKMGIRGEKNLKKFKNSLTRLISSGKICFDSKEHVYMLFKNSVYLRGTLLLDNKNRYYVQDGDTRYYLYARNMNGASYGDYIMFSYNYKTHGYEVNSVLKKDDSKYLAVICYHDGKLCAFDDKLGYLEIVDDKDYVPGTIVFIQRNGNFAKVLEVRCHKDDPNADILKIVYKHGFSDCFSKEVEKELVDIPDSLSIEDADKEISLGAVDLRDKDIVTIDCDDTKDIDDGVYVEVNSDGTYSLYVSIARVGHYVKDGSALAVRIKEAGTSVYPPGSVIPMLPRKLSNGICSLWSDQDRNAICFKTTFNQNGEVIDFDLFKSIINSKKKMTYSDVDSILEDEVMVPGYEKYYKNLLVMEKLYYLIARNFRRDGFLEIDTDEFEYKLNESKKIEDIEKKRKGIAANMIEVFMLITGRNAGEYFSNLGIPLIYRVDEEPNYKKISEVIMLLQSKDLLDKSIKVGDGEYIRDYYTKEELQSILKEVSKIKYPEVFYQMLIRTMSEAKYSVDNVGHYPLGFDYYAQVTSDIRRGGDWRNHTIIEYYLDSGKDVEATKARFSVESLEKEALVYSERQRAAKAVEAEANQMLLVDYVDKNKDKLNKEELIGRISEVGSSVRVLLDNGIKGKIVFPSTYNISGNSVYFGDRLICSIGDLVSVRIDGVKYKNSEVYMTLEKNLEKERCLDGEKKEKKVKIRKYIPSR